MSALLSKKAQLKSLPSSHSCEIIRKGRESYRLIACSSVGTAGSACSASASCGSRWTKGLTMVIVVDSPVGVGTKCFHLRCTAPATSGVRADARSRSISARPLSARRAPFRQIP
eukprot:scaffold15151_cov63-Phaeocystis_antarctica.AAC.5